MRKVRELSRLAWDMGLSIRQVARTCGVSHSTVSELIRRASAAGLSWPLPTEWDDAVLEDRLYRQPYQGVVEMRPQPDFAAIHRELRRKGVTLQLLAHGRNSIPTATSTASSASATAGGAIPSRSACGKCTGREKNCLWITPARAYP